MTTITITEALAEIKLIAKKLEGKVTTVKGNLTRIENSPDPLTDSKTVVPQEIQSIEDLSLRTVKIREAISGSNGINFATVLGDTKSISEWLAWKRESGPKLLTFYAEAARALKSAIDSHAVQPKAARDEAGNPVFLKLIVNVDYKTMLEKAQRTQETMDKLDGILSLKNATTFVTISE